MNGYRFLDDTGQHAHVLDDQPLHGTSTLIGEVCPPFLAKWGGQCAVDFIKDSRLEFAHNRYGGGEIETWDGETKDVSEWSFYPDKFFEILDKAPTAYTKVSKKAMQKGTNMHQELGDYVTHCIKTSSGVPQYSEAFGTGKVGLFAKWASKNIEKFIFSEAHTYSRELWVGGIVDVGAILKTGEFAIIDFKSGKVAYFSSFLQIGGYAIQIEETGWGDSGGREWHKLSPTGQTGAIEGLPDKVGALIIVPFGMDYLSPVIIKNVVEFKESFRHIVEVFKLQRAFKNR